MRKRASTYHFWIILGISLASVLISLGAYFGGLPFVCTDDPSRAYWALTWWYNPDLYRVISWLPGYNFIYGPIFALSSDPLLAGRTLTSLCSGGIVFLSAILAFDLTQSRAVSLVTALVVAFAPLQLWLSFSVLSEPIFNGFFILSLITLLRWLNSQKRSWLLCLIALSCIMSLTRYIAWPIALIYSGVIFYRLGFLRGLIPAVILYSVPFFWLIIVWLSSGDLFYPFEYYRQDSQEFYGREGHPNYIPFQAYLFLFPLNLVFLPWGLLDFKKTNRFQRNLCVIALAFVGLQIFMVWNQVPTVLPERSIFLSGLIGLIVSCIVTVHLWIDGSHRLRKVLVILGTFCLIVQIYGFSKLTPNLEQDTVVTAQELKKKIQSNEVHFDGLVGTDLDPKQAFTISLIIAKLAVFTSVKMDKKTKNFYFDTSRTRPSSFLFKDHNYAKSLTQQWPQARQIRVGEMIFFQNKTK